MNKTKWHAMWSIAVMVSASIAVAAEGELSAFEMKADANGDGKISYEEYRAAHEARLKARFERLDANSDGFVTFKEKKIAKQKQAAEAAAKEEAIREEVRKELSEDRKKRKRHFFKYQ